MKIEQKVTDTTIPTRLLTNIEVFGDRKVSIKSRDGPFIACCAM